MGRPLPLLPLVSEERCRGPSANDGRRAIRCLPMTDCPAGQDMTASGSSGAALRQAMTSSGKARTPSGAAAAAPEASGSSCEAAKASTSVSGTSSRQEMTASRSSGQSARKTMTCPRQELTAARRAAMDLTLHEVGGSGRKSAPSSRQKDQSRLTSAATVQGINARAGAGNSLREAKASGGAGRLTEAVLKPRHATRCRDLARRASEFAKRLECGRFTAALVCDGAPGGPPGSSGGRGLRQTRCAVVWA